MRYKLLQLTIVFSAGALLLSLPTTARAGGILPDTLGYSLALHSGQGLFDTAMSVAFDGTYYYGASGGNSGGSPLQKYDPATGNVLSNINSGVDFRSLVRDANGDLYARIYSDNNILKMTAPSVFTPVLTLDTSVIDIEDQAPVILNADGSAYASRFGDTIHFWSAVDGSFLSSLVLSDYGTVPGEDPVGGSNVRDVTLASFGSYYLTYLDNSDEVFAWDASGTRVGNMVLENNNGATAFSFSYSNGYLFTNDGEFHGYALAAPVAIPEPGAACLLLVGIGAGLALPRRRRI